MRAMSRVTPLPTSATGQPAQAPPGRDATRPAVAERDTRLLGLARPSSLAGRFLVASLAVLLAGGIVIGWWVGDQLQRGIIDRTASITGLYVQSFIEPHLESLADGEWLDDDDVADLDELLADTSFGERVVALKVWRPDGAIVYSPDRSLIGQRFAVEGGLAEALGGNVVAEMSSLEAAENAGESTRFDRLLEMYLPVRERGGGRIIAVAEFYQLPTEIDAQVADAQLQSWLVVALAIVLAYLLLYGIVRQGNDTIVRQQAALEQQVVELSTLLGQNERLRQRVRVAAERTTTLGERNLRRISADLHDGPGQMLALAMLRLDRLRSGKAPTIEQRQEVAELEAVLADALRDMRAIAAGLRVPELTPLSTGDICRRAVDDHVRRTGTAVDLRLDEPLPEASLPTKIALFRALQELLSNATRHGGGLDVVVELTAEPDRLRLVVSDGGPGIGVTHADDGRQLGLAGIREQAELLGGSFEMGPPAGTGRGAQVTVAWPL